MESAYILWHNSQSNETQIWFMNAGGDGITRRATVVDEHNNNIFVGSPWSIVGVSQGEIVWHNSQSNETQIWFMNAGGDGITRRATVKDEHNNNIFVGSPWSIVGVSQGEIVWHNSESNESQIWFMNAGGDGITRRATVKDEHNNNIFVGPPWSIVGVIQCAIAWHNSQTNETQIWFMNARGDGITRRATVVDEHNNTIFVGPPWSSVGVRAVPAVPVPPVAAFQPYRFNIDSVDIQNQKADGDHSDSDWLTLLITVADPAVKSDTPVQSKMFHLGGEIRTGDHITGDFSSDLFTAKDTDLVTVTYLIVNLGSSDAEAQFAQAVKITNKIVDDVGPIVGAAIGLFVGNPGAGIEISGQIIEAFDKVIKIAGDAFDFLGIHFGPAN